VSIIERTDSERKRVDELALQEKPRIDIPNTHHLILK